MQALVKLLRCHSYQVKSQYHFANCSAIYRLFFVGMDMPNLSRVSVGREDYLYIYCTIRPLLLPELSCHKLQR